MRHALYWTALAIFVDDNAIYEAAFLRWCQADAGQA